MKDISAGYKVNNYIGSRKVRNLYGDAYWKKKDYFKNCPCPWLAGYETVRGKYYKYNGKILVNQIRGNAILKYNVYAQ